MKNLSIASLIFFAALTVAANADPVVGTDGVARYRYGGKMVPTLHCAPLMVCDVQLNPDEFIKTPPVAGDTAQWIIRLGQGRQPYIYVKPVTSGLRTNLIVVTSKRTYHINLVSNETVAHTSLGFYYPHDATTSPDGADGVSDLSDAQQITLAVTTSQGISGGSGLATMSANGAALVDPMHLDHGYDVSGNAPFKPMTVFNDGTRTYIQLPEHLSEIPVIVGYDSAGTERTLNYETYNGYYVVNSLYPHLGLVLGTGRDRRAIFINKRGRA